jgi:hypothetical protein
MNMKEMYHGVLILAVAASSCVRSPCPPPAPLVEGLSIKFPEFHDQPAIQVGETNAPYQLDGVTLRALMIAANDFIPPSSEEQQCLFRQESQFYMVIRQGDIVFVQISYNPAACETKFGVLDGGARYAISTDGRILKRLIGIEPDGFPREEPPGESIPVPDSMVGYSFAEPNWEALPPSIRRRMQDAGTEIRSPGPVSSAPPDGGVPVVDGGLPEAAQDGGT